ncbi:Similar to Histone transcription regulator 3 homolog; acc. no. Q2UBW0 [Pyronema omphalodes CBS 100304]|uniref:Histone transcription regulator 3 homolog n=1 Tax=Pyronema omphalodes (strain CBS 100304) TaxID=1076935 RepID=U4LR46_PYROM|nr:Similar to Histone transcription regulator 3 homolog; acc. no. Q2UBW0 [Pyronema omphalodes CBS 100304]
MSSSAFKMSTFKPLNIIPDSDSEGEIDDTEEIQIEEALKLYQQALKFHTEGAWDDAQKAYKELFQSEIFRLDLEEQVHGRNNNAASSLPLVHYLAYKNRGTFKLDRLKATLPNHDEEKIRSTLTKALEWFATALERDAGDAALWRQSAQLAFILSSARLARFALESALDHETVGADASKEALSLVVGGYQNPGDQLASRHLLKILDMIGDKMSIKNGNYDRLRRTKLNKRFAKLLNPLPWLPEPLAENFKGLSVLIEQFSEKRKVITLTNRTWTEVGKALLEQLGDDNIDVEDVALSPSFDTIQLVLPVYEGEEESRDTTPDGTSPTESGPKSETATADDEADVTMTDASNQLLSTPAGRKRSGSANRKRKSTSMIDISDGRSRLSKRQRDKKAADAAAAEAAAATPERGSKVRQDTQDEKLFNTADECFSPLGLSLGNASTLKALPSADAMDTSDETEKQDKGDLAIEDFKAILQTWDDDKGNVILYGDGIQTPADAAQGMSFLDLEANVPSKPLLSKDEGLRKWARNINTHGLTANQAAFEWLKSLCKKEPDNKHKKSRPSVSAGKSSWVKHSWPEPLKSTALTIASKCEDICFNYFKNAEDNLNLRLATEVVNYFTEDDYTNTEFAQTLLELYLDDLAMLERDRTGGDLTSDLEMELKVKRDRVLRWGYLVGDLMHHRPRDKDGQMEEDQLTLRFLWATTVITGFTEDCTREFRLACFEDLKGLLADRPPVDIPNSVIMPEISAARAEREISKLKTVDFFSTIFAVTSSEGEQKNPEDVIDVLEAVLNPCDVLPYDEEEGRLLADIGRFLDGSSTMFKLHLWEKLKAAYEGVKDTAKTLMCTLKCVQILVNELKSRTYLESSQDHRQFVLLRSLRLIQEMVLDVLKLMEAPENIAALSDQELTDSLAANLTVLRIMHCYAFWESAVQKSEVKASDLHSYRIVAVKFRDMLVQGWIIAYQLYEAMLDRGMGADKEDGWDEEDKEEKLTSLLRDLHQELGDRHYCKLHNHSFLKLSFNRLMKFDNRDNDGDLLQIVHCRFHLTLCQDQYYFFDHKTIPEILPRDIALKLLSFIMHQISKKKLLQLGKSDLKTGLDKLLEVLGTPPLTNSRILHNKAQIDAYLKTSLDPLKLFGAMRGRLDISTIEIFGPYREIQQSGLYFTLGKIALYPMKFTKRQTPLKTEEAEAAISMFRYELFVSPDSWEAWYRLAQAFEIQLDENQIWSAEAMNTKSHELTLQERQTILCYMMALSLSVRYADLDDEEEKKTLGELYYDFGTRLYAACRPPMNLQAFKLDGIVRHFSGQMGQGLYTSPPHMELEAETGMRFALNLFQKAIEDPDSEGAENWKNHYMAGKCAGKLREHLCIPCDEILQYYVSAISLTPEQRGDIVFEPHHKLVSQAAKYVFSELMPASEACEIISSSCRFAKGVEPVSTKEEFANYAVEVLKRMKAADKAKWHHRMTHRISRIKKEQLNDIAGARAEFGTIWSHKGEKLAIWKPEFERSGRHYHYAAEYTMYYANLLHSTGERTTMENLCKRIRRVPHVMFRHTDVWAFLFDRYISLIRSSGEVPQVLEDEVFKNITADEFTQLASKLDAYCNNATNGGKDIAANSTLALLREVFELRRLNAGLAKNPAIDVLLTDTYAKLWQELVPGLVEQEKEQQANPMSLKNMMFDSSAAPTPPLQQTTIGPDGMELQIRTKSTKVYHRDLISKATNLCKEMSNQTTVGTAGSGNKKTTDTCLSDDEGGTTSAPTYTPSSLAAQQAANDQLQLDLQLQIQAAENASAAAAAAAAAAYAAHGGQGMPIKQSITLAQQQDETQYGDGDTEMGDVDTDMGETSYAQDRSMVEGDGTHGMDRSMADLSQASSELTPAPSSQNTREIPDSQQDTQEVVMGDE